MEINSNIQLLRSRKTRSTRFEFYDRRAAERLESDQSAVSINLDRQRFQSKMFFLAGIVFAGSRDIDH